MQKEVGSPTLWGDACCVMLSGTMPNVVRAQRMILERIANISDRLKMMVRTATNVARDATYLYCGSFLVLYWRGASVLVELFG